MSKNRKVKRSPRTGKPPARTARRRPSEGRSREIVGIVSLGSAIFVIAALSSLQIGDGGLMGPFGRSIASTVYAFGGMCSYLIAVGLLLVALRLLTDRETVLAKTELAGIALGLVSIATLVHLVGSGYRVAGYGPGGVLGEHFAEVLRAVISTAGTALVALTGLVCAVVVATPLRMKAVLGLLARGGLWIWDGVQHAGATAWAGVLGAGRFCGDVVHAILPERDRDAYAEDVEWASAEDEGYDAYELEDEEEEAAPEPPIIEHDSAAVPRLVEDSNDTERIDEHELERRLAEARAEWDAAQAEEAEEDEEPILLDKPKRTKKSKKSKKADKSKNKAKLAIALVADSEEADDAEGVEAPDQEVLEQDVVAEESVVAAVDAGNGPVIVESQFRQKGAEELEGDGQRLDFIPLGDGDYQLPSINLLDYDDSSSVNVDKTAMLELSARLTQTLEHYKIKGEVVAIRPGPVVTMYEFAPAPGTRLNKIVNLSDDLAMALEAFRIRIVAPIPGKAAVGIEVPNKQREMVYLKEILADEVFQQGKAKLPLSMGKDIEGAPVVVDLAKMPHLLVAGTTGSGKSVSVNSMITSMLYHMSPEDLRLIMVDPKMLELSIYEGIPHLLLPVVTDPKKANLALRWAVEEMERRYQLLSDMRVRDIATYNKKQAKLQATYEADKLRAAADEAERLAEAEQDEEVEITEERQMHLPAIEPPPSKLPFIVVVIDEFADLMMCAPKEVETSVARIAQKARAAGIHLILATQRPSVNVITGLIKANFPSRVAFRVASKVDSRTILDQMGAERLLGSGDMLFSDRGAAPQRIHGCFVNEEEISRVVDFLKEQGKPVYNLEILKPRDDEEDGEGGGTRSEDMDEMYDRAVVIVSESRQVSISMIQRRLRIGYNRAARIVEAMESEGVVSTPDHKNKREVLVAAA